MTKLEYLIKQNGYFELCDVSDFIMYGRRTEELSTCLIFWKEKEEFPIYCQDNHKNFIPVVLGEDMIEMLKEIKSEYDLKGKDKESFENISLKESAMNIAKANAIYKNMRDYKREEDVNGKDTE